MALAWLLFPMLPVVLEDFYYQVCVNLLGSSRAGPDPHDWGWGTWVVMLGPLIGYGFLAGSTAEVPDEVSRTEGGRCAASWPGGLSGSRSAPGPGFFSSLECSSAWHPPRPTSQERPIRLVERDLGLRGACHGPVTVILVGIFAYGWLWPAWAALRRAGRIGLWRRALYRGTVTALAFVGSLFGSFWAITSAWRSFFFDPRVMPMIALALSLVVLSGCAAPVTYGEMRRRELFHAMLLAWVFGLALIWWWSSRRRRRPPRPVRWGARRARSS